MSGTLTYDVMVMTYGYGLNSLLAAGRTAGVANMACSVSSLATRF